MSGVVELRVLGTLNVTRRQESAGLAEVSQDKRLALLTYLALEGRAGPVRREKVLGVFWPERSEPRARNLLSQALCQFRKALGEGAVRSSGARDVWLDPARVWCDAVAFQELLEAGRPEAALELYRGPLMDGFVPRGIHEFMEWLDLERPRLLGLARAAAMGLSDRAARRDGDLQRATARARWIVRQAPFDEAALRHLLELLARSGRCAEAVWEYRRFRDRMRRELDLEPDPRTRSLVGSLRGEEGVEFRARPSGDPRRPPLRARPRGGTGRRVAGEPTAGPR
jgi:DNA-binding SARP family transcriptional activator